METEIYLFCTKKMRFGTLRQGTTNTNLDSGNPSTIYTSYVVNIP